MDGRGESFYGYHEHTLVSAPSGNQDMDAAPLPHRPLRAHLTPSTGHRRGQSAGITFVQVATYNSRMLRNLQDRARASATTTTPSSNPTRSSTAGSSSPRKWPKLAPSLTAIRPHVALAAPEAPLLSSGLPPFRSRARPWPAVCTLHPSPIHPAEQG